MILAMCQCQHIFCCWVEPSLLLSSFEQFFVSVDKKATQNACLSSISATELQDASFFQLHDTLPCLSFHKAEHWRLNSLARHTIMVLNLDPCSREWPFLQVAIRFSQMNCSLQSWHFRGFGKWATEAVFFPSKPSDSKLVQFAASLALTHKLFRSSATINLRLVYHFWFFYTV